MKLLNKYNIPEGMFRAIEANIQPPRADETRVTNLIESPRMRQLTLRHWDRLESDVSENLWSLLGTAVHGALEGHGEGKHEEKIAAVFNGMRISGHYDFFDEAGIIHDYKVVSVFAFLLGEKPSWERQLNCYAHIMRSLGETVNGLEIDAILRDHVKAKTESDPDYPKCPFQAVSIPLWTPEQAERYILERVAIHQAAELMPDADLPNCTEEERWVRGAKWAVIKDGNQRAVALFDNRDEAEAKAEKVGKGAYAIHRAGSSVRCRTYCTCREVCDKRIQNCEVV